MNEHKLNTEKRRFVHVITAFWRKVRVGGALYERDFTATDLTRHALPTAVHTGQGDRTPAGIHCQQLTRASDRKQLWPGSRNHRTGRSCGSTWGSTRFFLRQTSMLERKNRMHSVSPTSDSVLAPSLEVPMHEIVSF